MVAAWTFGREPKVLIAAHMGCHGRRGGVPANSLPALRSCVAAGIGIIEVDLKKTSDDHYVLMHNRTVDDTTNGRGSVSGMTLAQVTGLRLRAGEGRGGSAPVTQYRVPSLDAALQVIKGSRSLLNLDKLASSSLWTPLYTRLKSRGLGEQVIFKTSYQGRSLLGLRSFPKGMKVVPILRPPLSDAHMAQLAVLHQEGRAPFAVELGGGFDGWVPRTPTERSQVRALRRMGVRVWVNTLGYHYDLHGSKFDRAAGRTQWDLLVDAGVDLIQTDYPKELASYLKGRGMR